MAAPKSMFSENVIINSVLTDTHITALHFIDSYLLAGEGCTLSVYDINTKETVIQRNVLYGSNIHGIRTDDNKNDIPSQSYKLCIFGGISVKILELSLAAHNIRIDDLTDVLDFEDWVWDVRWVHHVLAPSGLLAAVLGHNVLVVWDWKRNLRLHTLHCDEQCILYSASLAGSTMETLTVLGGTVFREIVIWCARGPENKHGSKKILHRLQGHKGVIFSVNFNSHLQKLCSTSDDRSIHVWQLKLSTPRIDNNNSDLNVEAWTKASFELIAVLYGHMARVWRAIPLKDCLVSIGEDSVICLWTYTGAVLQKVRAHRGGSVWSLAVNKKETVIATGGSDAGIRLWPAGLDMFVSNGTSTGITLPVDLVPQDEKVDFPRTVGLLDMHNLLIMTNAGVLYCYNNTSKEWTVLLNDPTYNSYSLMVPAPWGRHVALGSLSGQVLIIDTGDSSNGTKTVAYQCVREQIYSGKILALTWLDKSRLLTCGSYGKMILWRLKRSTGCLQIVLQCNYLLPACKQRWISAALLVPKESLLACGDRCGSIHVYHHQVHPDSTDQQTSIQSFTSIHGKTGVTDICYHDNSIYSAGRDGLIHIFCIKSSRLEEVRSIKVTKGLDWISKLIFVKDDLVVLGFHTKTFVAWSWEQQRTFISLPCGGGHRSWDFKISENGACLVYIRSGEVRQNLIGVTTRIPPVIKSSLHGREISDIKYLFTTSRESDPVYVCATSSEDITINLIAFSGSNQSLKKGLNFFERNVVCMLQGHISSIRTLAVCSIDPKPKEIPSECSSTSRRSRSKSPVPKIVPKQYSELLIFSAGGRAQLTCWQVTETEPVQGIKGKVTGSICVSQLLATHSLRGQEKKNRKPWKNPELVLDPETRYMNFTAIPVVDINSSLPSHLYLAVGACSDGYVRVFGFNYEVKKLQLLSELAFHECCVLQVAHFLIHHQGLTELILVSAATNGQIAFWNLTDIAIAFADAETRNHNESKVSYNEQDDKLTKKEDTNESSRSLSNIPSEHSSLNITSSDEEFMTKSCYSTSLVSQKLCPKNDKKSTGKLLAQGVKSSTRLGKDIPKQLTLKDDDDSIIPHELGIEISTLLNGRIYKNMKENRAVKNGISQTVVPFFVQQSHQSGINSICIQEIAGDKFLVVSGGDDNALQFSVVRAYPFPPLPDIKVNVLATQSIVSAHSAQVTGIKTLPNCMIASTSIDQRINIWHWRFNANSELSVQLITSKFSSIADISCLDVWTNPTEAGSHLLCVAGEGLQLFHCLLPQPVVERLI